MKDQNGWLLLLWEGDRLFAAFGPFSTQEKAKEAARKEPNMRADVLPLWKTSVVGK